MKVGHHMFPFYYCLWKSKKTCYPPQEHIVVTEIHAQVKLQALLDETIERLVEAQREVMNSVLPNSSFNLISKWS